MRGSITYRLAGIEARKRLPLACLKSARDRSSLSLKAIAGKPIGNRRFAFPPVKEPAQSRARRSKATVDDKMTIWRLKVKLSAKLEIIWIQKTVNYHYKSISYVFVRQNGEMAIFQSAKSAI